MAKSKSLWEENAENENENPQSEDTPVSNIKHDKIFHNDYNSGNIEFEEFGMPRVDSEYADSYMENYYSSADYHARMAMMEKVDQIFQESEYGKALKNKRKIPKQLHGKIYVSLHQSFETGDVTEIEIFTSVAEYFGISYEIFYENIPAIYREKLVKELDEKFSILKRKGMRRLF
jgi:hypothetical protein